VSWFNDSLVFVRFGSNEWLRKSVFPKHTRTHIFTAGIGAGVCEAVLVVTPAETLKVLYQENQVFYRLNSSMTGFPINPNTRESSTEFELSSSSRDWLGPTKDFCQQSWSKEATKESDSLCTTTARHY
jgi:hypothetical protein